MPKAEKPPKNVTLKTFISVLLLVCTFLAHEFWQQWKSSNQVVNWWILRLIDKDLFDYQLDINKYFKYAGVILAFFLKAIVFYRITDKIKHLRKLSIVVLIYWGFELLLYFVHANEAPWSLILPTIGIGYVHALGKRDGFTKFHYLVILMFVLHESWYWFMWSDYKFYDWGNLEYPLDITWFVKWLCTFVMENIINLMLFMAAFKIKVLRKVALGLLIYSIADLVLFFVINNQIPYTILYAASALLALIIFEWQLIVRSVRQKLHLEPKPQHTINKLH